MTVTIDQVRAKVNASAATLPNTDIELALGVATELVAQHIGTATVPPSVKDRAVLLVAVEQVNQDNAPNGIVNQAFTDGLGDSASAPVRIGRDPMKPALPILAPYVSGRFFCA